MIDLDIVAPLMFVGLAIVMLLGYPVAFSLAALGLAFGFVGVQLGFFPAQYLANIPLRIFGILSNDLLLAIPFFTFMGAILGAITGTVAASVIAMGMIALPIMMRYGYRKSGGLASVNQ